MGIFKRIYEFFFVAKECNKKEFLLNFRIDQCENGIVKFQMINTRQIFTVKLHEVIENIDYILGLHPSESCFLGVEFQNANFELSNQHFERIDYISKLYRYGSLKYLSMNPDISGQKVRYKSLEENKIFFKCPIKLAKDQNLIDKFDPAQAFIIGIEAAKKIQYMIAMKSVKSSESKMPRDRKSKLYVVE